MLCLNNSFKNCDTNSTNNNITFIKNNFEISKINIFDGDISLSSLQELQLKQNNPEEQDFKGKKLVIKPLNLNSNYINEFEDEDIVPRIFTDDYKNSIKEIQISPSFQSVYDTFSDNKTASFKCRSDSEMNSEEVRFILEDNEYILQKISKNNFLKGIEIRRF
jgi:hypothetical protein